MHVQTIWLINKMFDLLYMYAKVFYLLFKFMCLMKSGGSKKLKTPLNPQSREHERLFFKLGFTPCKAEQALRGMELQEKEAQKRL